VHNLLQSIVLFSQFKFCLQVVRVVSEKARTAMREIVRCWVFILPTRALFSQYLCH